MGHLQHSNYYPFHYFNFWSWAVILIFFICSYSSAWGSSPPAKHKGGGVAVVGGGGGKPKESWIPGLYQRHHGDGRTQTNLLQFFEGIPHGPNYRSAVLGTKFLKIGKKNKWGYAWELTSWRKLQLQLNSSAPLLFTNHTMIFRPGFQINDAFLGHGIQIKTTATVKENRMVLVRDMNGVNVFEVMHFSRHGCRTTYYTSEEYGIDFLRRVVVGGNGTSHH